MEEKKERKYNITPENAREMQQRGLEKRRSEAVRKKQIKNKLMKDIIRAELMKPVSEKDSRTKLEAICDKVVRSMIASCTIKDVATLQEILGEKIVSAAVSVSNRAPEDFAREFFSGITLPETYDIDQEENETPGGEIVIK